MPTSRLHGSLVRTGRVASHVRVLNRSSPREELFADEAFSYVLTYDLECLASPAGAYR
jgi:hypothetical protein